MRRTARAAAALRSRCRSSADSGSDAALTDDHALAGSGGAVYAPDGSVAIGNVGGSLALSGNSAGLDGGAVFAAADLSGKMTVENNSAGGNGGAVKAASAALNGEGIFSGNHAEGLGGAVYVGGGGDGNILSVNAITGDITFVGNSQGISGARRANAIFIASDAAVTFAAAAGRTIAFFDPIANVDPLISVTKTGPGMVSFDGSNYSNLADQTSLVYANTEVAEGTFEIANNAVYGVKAADAGGTTPSTLVTAPGTILQGGRAGHGGGRSVYARQ